MYQKGLQFYIYIQMTQGNHRSFFKAEVKVKAEVKIVVRSLASFYIVVKWLSFPYIQTDIRIANILVTFFIQK